MIDFSQDVFIWQDAAIYGVLALWLVTLVWLVGAILRQRRRLEQTCQVRITNVGNLRSAYELRAVAEGEALWFQVVQPAVDDEVAPAPIAPSAAAASGPRGLSATMGRTAPPPGGPVQNVGRMLADLLSGLGYMLPGALGSGLLNLSRGLYQAGYNVRRVQGMARQATQASESFRQLTGQGAAPATAGRAPVTATERDAAATARPKPQPRTAVVVPAEKWVPLPALRPGEALTVTLLAQPRALSGQRSHRFQVITRCVEHQEAPPVVRQGTLRVDPVAWWPVYVPGALCFLAAVAAGMMIGLWWLIPSWSG